MSLLVTSRNETSEETEPRLSVTDYAVLGLLAEEPGHGFAVAKKLVSDTEVGRIFTVRRPLVYRAIDRLDVAGYIATVTTERGEGPERVIYRPTPGGLRRLRRWLTEPVEHVRDLRIEFLLKLALLRRTDKSPLALIRRQRKVLDSIISALDDPDIDPDDHVELWRRHVAAASGAYLRDLELHYVEDSDA